MATDSSGETVPPENPWALPYAASTLTTFVALCTYFAPGLTMVVCGLLSIACFALGLRWRLSHSGRTGIMDA